MKDWVPLIEFVASSARFCKALSEAHKIADKNGDTVVNLDKETLELLATYEAVGDSAKGNDWGAWEKPCR